MRLRVSAAKTLPSNQNAGEQGSNLIKFMAVERLKQPESTKILNMSSVRQQVKYVQEGGQDKVYFENKIKWYRRVK